MNASPLHVTGSAALRRVMARALAMSMLTVLFVACAAPPIERLYDEPKAAATYTKPTASAPPVADAINRFIAAVRKGATEEANEGLSRRTRMALEMRARTVGLRGVDLLRPPGDKLSASARKLFVLDPIARFTLRNLKTIRVGERPWPMTKPHDGRALRWSAELVDKTGKTREVTLLFEGISWRIHNPSLAAK